MSLMGEAGCTPPGNAIGNAEKQACAVGWDIVLVRLSIVIVSGITTGQNGRIVKPFSPSSIDMLIESIYISTPQFLV